MSRLMPVYSAGSIVPLYLSAINFLTPDDFDVNPLFFCFLSHGFDDFSMRTRCGSDLDFLVAATGTLAIKYSFVNALKIDLDK